MTLTLTIAGRDTLDNGQPACFRLDRHGALIGRSTHADWCLPDPRNHVSARHCEISYRDGTYLLVDRSTNGTFVNGAETRLTAPHPIRDGDRLDIGAYAIHASLSAPDAAATAPPEAGSEAEPAPAAWSAWPDTPTSPAAAPPLTPPVADGGGWDTPAPLALPSAWSSAPAAAAPPSAVDLWGQLARESDIDWSQGGFSAPPAALAADRPLAPEAPAAPRPAAPAASPAAAAPPEGGWAQFVAGLGLTPEALDTPPAPLLATAGALLRQLVSGLVLMVDARARAKAQLGLQGTSLELEGNNPLKFVRAPERALRQLLAPAEPGFMPAARAVEDAFQDLQAHQMATLGAMRGALAETLARFSPAAIRARQPAGGWRARLRPGAADAALWRAYEAEFEGVVRGADEAFMDLFAREFRRAYEDQVAEMKGRRPPPG
ncbi:type VI secretion system-associated FHA domain protein TagH [Sphingomonas morindae]|uniref:Type VI secretion system-associated FHA domain protein TagH n=1 Tax=Sphingomonas morindae TaxID=1541170 RepID=A0ABY4XDZ2_9SPHN|nr:type VI secretion system-associated FHA domain protein TagH [Sphingomonas morindae]USI74915.1 type VI secretion system-associated FHA domain protein TagH [Sphingomonas morindae]